MDPGDRSKWNIIRTARTREDEIVVEEMSAEDIARYFPQHVRAEMTGRFKAIEDDDTLADTVLTRAAHS